MSSGAPLVEIAAGFPQLVIEHICAALQMPALAALACCPADQVWGLLLVAGILQLGQLCIREVVNHLWGRLGELKDSRRAPAKQMKYRRS